MSRVPFFESTPSYQSPPPDPLDENWAKRGIYRAYRLPNGDLYLLNDFEAPPPNTPWVFLSQCDSDSNPSDLLEDENTVAPGWQPDSESPVGSPVDNERENVSSRNRNCVGEDQTIPSRNLPLPSTTRMSSVTEPVAASTAGSFTEGSWRGSSDEISSVSGTESAIDSPEISRHPPLALEQQDADIAGQSGRSASPLASDLPSASRNPGNRAQRGGEIATAVSDTTRALPKSVVVNAELSRANPTASFRNALGATVEATCSGPLTSGYKKGKHYPLRADTAGKWLSKRPRDQSLERPLNLPAAPRTQWGGGAREEEPDGEESSGEEQALRGRAAHFVSEVDEVEVIPNARNSRHERTSRSEQSSRGAGERPPGGQASSSGRVDGMANRRPDVRAASRTSGARHGGTSGMSGSREREATSRAADDGSSVSGHHATRDRSVVPRLGRTMNLNEGESSNRGPGVSRVRLDQERNPPRREPVAPYKIEEDYLILAFLCALPHHSFIRGNEVYRVMAAYGAVGPRRKSWEGMRNRFMKVIDKRLQSYSNVPVAFRKRIQGAGQYEPGDEKRYMPTYPHPGYETPPACLVGIRSQDTFLTVVDHWKNEFRKVRAAKYQHLND